MRRYNDPFLLLVGRAHSVQQPPDDVAIGIPVPREISFQQLVMDVRRMRLAISKTDPDIEYSDIYWWVEERK